MMAGGRRKRSTLTNYDSSPLLDAATRNATRDGKYMWIYNKYIWIYIISYNALNNAVYTYKYANIRPCLSEEMLDILDKCKTKLLHTQLPKNFICI